MCESSIKVNCGKCFCLQRNPSRGRADIEVAREFNRVGYFANSLYKYANMVMWPHPASTTRIPNIMMQAGGHMGGAHHWVPERSSFPAGPTVLPGMKRVSGRGTRPGLRGAFACPRFGCPGGGAHPELPFFFNASTVGTL